MFHAYSSRRSLGSRDLAGLRALYPAGWSAWEIAPVGVGPNPGLDVSSASKRTFFVVFVSASAQTMYYKTRDVVGRWGLSWASYDSNPVWTATSSGGPGRPAGLNRLDVFA